MTSHPELRTARLLLRPVRDSDDEVIFLLRSDDWVNKYLDRQPAQTIDDARKHIEKIRDGYSKGTAYYWVIITSQKQQPIGTICIWNLNEQNNSGEIGYEILPAYKGQGYMNEAIEAVKNFCGQTLSMSRLTAWTHSDNAPSKRLLEKNGFERDLEEEKIYATSEDLSQIEIYSCKI